MKRYIKSSHSGGHIRPGSIPFEQFSDYYDAVVDDIGNHALYRFLNNPERYLYEMTDKGNSEQDNLDALQVACEDAYDKIEEMQDAADYDSDGDMLPEEELLWDAYESYKKEFDAAFRKFDKNARSFFRSHFKIIEPMLDAKYPSWSAT